MTVSLRMSAPGLAARRRTSLRRTARSSMRGAPANARRRRVRRSGCACVDRLDDLVVLGEATFIVSREDDRAIDLDVEDAAAALDENGLDAGPSLQLGRQTGGPWKVVSDAAVRDRDLHAILQSSRRGR
jgi:hypothetical protein